MSYPCVPHALPEAPCAPPETAPVSEAPGWSPALGFFLFLLVNAVLYIRPGDLAPELESLEPYNLLMVACLVVAAPGVLEQLSLRSLAARPVTVCVLGLVAAVALSHVAHFQLARALEDGFEFLKVAVYYLLLVALVSSADRLRRFLYAVAAFLVVAAGLALLHYHGAIQLPHLTVLQDRDVARETGQEVLISRLRSTGHFGDPNDLCLALVGGMLIGLYGLGDRRRGPLRFLWLGPLLVLGLAVAETQSRGGFLALLAGLLVLLWARFGWWKSLALAGLVLPAAFVLFEGRQTQISPTESTGQDRVQLWAAAIRSFREAPGFGIGEGTFAEREGLVAHNSFLHCFAELGFFGGTCFLGAFGVAGYSLRKLGSDPALLPDPELRRLRPYLLAVVTATAVGLMALSRNYDVTIYTIIGAAVAFVRVASASAAGGAGCEGPAGSLPVPRCGPRLAAWLAAAGVAFLAGMSVVVRLLLRGG